MITYELLTTDSANLIADKLGIDRVEIEDDQQGFLLACVSVLLGRLQTVEDELLKAQEDRRS